MANNYEYALTTFDNPYDPFEQFVLWDLYDHRKGYNSKERLARFVKVTDEMTQQEENEEIERAIDEIIRYDFLNIYKKVTRKVENDENNSENE